MQSFLTLIGQPVYINGFQNLSTWLVWGGLFAILVMLVIRNWKSGQPFATGNLWSLLALVISVVIFNVYAGIRIPVDQLTPLPGTIANPQAPDILLLALIPILIWAGASGMSSAILAGVLIGLVRGLLETHSLFSIVEYGAVAYLMALFLRQNYRTGVYRFLRHPIGSVIVTALLTCPLYVLSMFMAVQGSVPVKLDFAFTQTYPLMIARAAELLIAGSITEILYLMHIILWYRPTKLAPTPSETSIQVRFFNRIAPLLFVLLLGLVVGDWLVAGNAAKQLMRDRLESTASIAAKNLPYFMETGQNLLLNLAQPDLIALSPDELQTALSDKLRVVPYFQQLYLFDANGNALGGYPVNDEQALMLSKEERAGLKFAADGVLIQTYTIQPNEDSPTAQISMIAISRDENGLVQEILLGRTDLSSNPYTQPAILALNEINAMGGEGILVDETNHILYHPITSLVMSEYIGNIPAAPGFYEDVSSNGNKTYLYYAAVVGRPWKVLLTVPVEQTQQIALNIAFPVFILIVIFSAVVFVSLRYGLGAVTGSLNRLAKEAGAIASGELENPMQVHRNDEVGKFSQSFETMRVRLKKRLEELNGLLVVSEGVARHVEVEQSMKKIMEVACAQGADSVRILLKDPSDKSSLHIYSDGTLTSAYADLDQQIVDMMASEDQLIIPNTTRLRRIRGKMNATLPGAIVALTMRMDENDYGIFWMGYESPRTFDPEQVQFLNTLSFQASIAAANASLFSSVNVGRQRLEAVLRATPEPVLVIDENKQVILMNPAAMHVDGLVNGSEIDRPVSEVIIQPDLRSMLTATQINLLDSMKEIAMPDGLVFEVTLSPVQITKDTPAGVVCTLRDITRYKKQDSLKSDFVATVSHDLRVPLSMLRGYVTMLPMVGEINPQQKEFVEKIESVLERMAKLTENVLNMQRIESGVALNIQEIDPEKVVQLVNQILLPQANQKKIKLQSIIKTGNDEHATPIEADADLLQQALYNLVENAIKFTPVKGEVTVTYEETEREGIFSVADNGSGIAPLDLQGIFNRKKSTADQNGEGNPSYGYGLTIVRSIALRHHGKTWVESKLGQGSEFYMSIPLKQDSK